MIDDAILFISRRCYCSHSLEQMRGFMSEDHYVHRLRVSMPLASAEQIVDAAIATGREAGLLPLTVAVLDAGGHVVLLKREDGSGNLRADVAIGKAWGALGMGIPSRTIRDRMKDRPAFQGALAAAAQGRFIPVPGGVLASDADGVVIGAVGISGDASDRDEYAAIVGIRAAGLMPYPEQPAPDWQAAKL
ncbi:MAG: heme-binding protein [Hyphomicrobiaceae bacterium]